MRMPILALACAALLALCAAGCSSTKPKWVEADVEAASERVLWQVAMLAMEKNDFPPSAEQDRAGGVAVSGWRISLQPFKGKGYRDQCEVNFSSLGERKWHVKVRVRRETNEELARPLELPRAKWEPAADSEDSARLVLRYIRTLLGGDFRVGPKATGPGPEARPAG